MPVIKQSTRSSNVIVSASGKSSNNTDSSENRSSPGSFKQQKQKEYKVKLSPSIFRSKFINSISNRTSAFSTSSSRNFVDAGVIRVDVDTTELDRAVEIVNTTSEIFDLGIGEFDITDIDTGITSFDETFFSPDYDITRINDSFGFTGLGELIERSRKSLKNTNIKVLSHEVFKINKQSHANTSFDTNLLFLDTRSQANSTLLNLKNSEIEKKEALSDKLFVYVDDFKHNDLIQKSYSESLSLVDKIDQTSKIGNKLENEINYGNIVENFIKEGKSNFIGKISNQILLSSNNYSTLIGNDDEVLLDLQQKSLKSVLDKENLDIFYKNVSGFDYKEKDTRFSNSVSNFKIVNTDRLVGQLMVNYAVGLNSIYPNSDNVSSLEYYDSPIRKKINGSAFNKYPVIQFENFNINSRIFSNKKLEFLAVTGNALNIDKVLNNVDESLVNEDYLPSTVIKSFLLFSANEINTVGKKYNEGEDINTRGTSYRNRKSFAGKRSSSVSIPKIDNNIFSIKVKDNSTLRRRTNNPEFLFEKIYLDVDTKSHSKNDYLLPCFLKLPTRYFAKTLVSRDSTSSFNAIERLRQNEESNLNLNNSAIVNLSNETSITKIRRAILTSFFINYNASDVFNNLEEDNSLNGGRDLASFLDARKSFLDVLENKYSKFLIGEDTPSNTIRIEGSSDSLYFETYLDNYIIRKKDNIGIVNESNSLGNALFAFENEDIDDNISSQFESYLGETGSGNIYANKEKEIKNDCFVFKASNSFLSSKEINEVVLSNYNNIKIRDLGLQLVETKRLQKASDRFLNKSNSSDNVLSVFGGENSAALLTLKISNIINLARKKLSDDVQFVSIFNKAKSKVVQQDNFTLLYDTFKENCLDTFEESPFITSEGFYKNNFVEEFSLEAKNTTKLVIDKEKDIEDSKIFTSKSFREYLSKIYTKSFLRNKTTLFNRILKDNVDMFQLDNDYPNSVDISNYFGFDVLLAKSFSGTNSNNANEIKDVCKVILANSIIKSCGIDNQIKSVYKRPAAYFRLKEDNNVLNKDISDDLRKIFGEQIVNNFVNVVFNKENIHSMNNKVIRSVHTNSMKKFRSFNLTSIDALNGLSLDYVNGNMCELIFPGYHVVEKFGEGRNSIKSVSTDTIRNSSTISEEYIQGSSGIDSPNVLRQKKILKESLYQASSNMLYNYDIFINEDKTGIVFYDKNAEDSSFVTKGFNFIKDEVNKGIDLRISYKTFRNILKSDIGLDENQVGSTKMPYRDSDIFIPMSYFYLSKKRNTFSNKVTNLCTDMLSVFDIKYDNIRNVEEVIQFIDNNSYLIQIAHDLLEAFSIIYLQSFENYNTYIEEKIRLESINKDMTKEEFESVVKDYNILNSSLEDRSFCVSDIKSILRHNEGQINEPKYQLDDIAIQNLPVVINRETIYTKRFFELQVVNKILQNSDISEAICLDIIHGYFSNLESNKNLESETKKDLESNIEEINRKVNSIQGLDGINIESYIFNEFYQNKLSKDIQEVMFYKNIFNETFIKNNLYNSNRQKYENENMFNHRKLFYLNNYNRGIQSLSFIGDYQSRESLEGNRNLDILKIPIDFNTANKVGTRGFLKINIQPVNLKYPEIEYKSITKYYTPMLTGLTSNFMSTLSNNFFNFCGIYNDTQKISERYNVVSKDVAVSEVRDLISDVFSLKAEEEQIAFNVDTYNLSEGIYEDNIISSAVSHLDFITQSSLNENVNVKGKDLNNLVSKETISLLNSIDIESLKKTIEKIDENILRFDFFEEDKEYAQTLDNSNVLKNNMFYHKFIKDLDRDVSQQDLILAMIPNNLYDVFNIVIDRDLINIDTESSSNEISAMGLDHFNNPVGLINRNLCISYYISFEVL